MKAILESLKAEFVTVKDDDGFRLVVRTWHVLCWAFALGWFIG